MAASKNGKGPGRNGRKQRSGRESTQFKPGNKGRPKGARNKTTQLQLEAARDAFAPLAQLGLQKGLAHLTDCEVDGCGSCQHRGDR